MRQVLLATPILALLSLAACGRGELEGPPTLRLGRDECGECGMTVQEERSAAAILVERGGRREYVVFDDIGCMLDTMRLKGVDLRVVDSFVHDYSDSEWTKASTAVFLATNGSGLRTPMGSGIAAYADRAKAERGQQQFKGTIVDFKAVSAWRGERMEDRTKASGG